MMPLFRPHSSANVERIEFAKKLINLMRDNNLNQSELARKAGMTRDAVSSYCRARSMPEPPNLARLAAALNVEPSYFQLDVNRVAERMGSPDVFDPRSVGQQMLPSTTPAKFSMSIDGDGNAIVSIHNAVMPIDKATELLSFFKKQES